MTSYTQVAGIICLVQELQIHFHKDVSRTDAAHPCLFLTNKTETDKPFSFSSHRAFCGGYSWLSC